MIRSICCRLAAFLLIAIASATLPGCGMSRRDAEAPAAAVVRAPVTGSHGSGHIVGLAQEEDAAAFAVE